MLDLAAPRCCGSCEGSRGGGTSVGAGRPRTALKGVTRGADSLRHNNMGQNDFIIRNPILRVSTPTRRSCASARILPSRPPRSSGTRRADPPLARLVHWRLLTRPLGAREPVEHARRSGLVRRWAPCLTHADGLFHSCTPTSSGTAARRRRCVGASLRDFHNYLVTSPRSTASGAIRCI